MTTKTTFKLASKAELDRKTEELKEHLAREKFTINHMAFMTGWHPNYLRILERQGRIPKALRRDQLNGIKVRYWEEEGARAILAFKIGQEKKRGGSKGKK